MATKGMQSYYKYESITMETAGKFSLNLSYKLKDYFLTIPLVSTRGSDKISLSAIYSSANSSYKNYGSKFCLGTNCNLYLPTKITQVEINSKIETLSADGDIREYLYIEDNIYENEDTHSKIQIINNGYVLTNNDGDKLYYADLNCFPYQIEQLNGTTYTIIENNDSIVFSNSISSSIEILSSDSNVSTLIYYENGEVISRVSFVYENGSLIGIKYYDGYYFQDENKYCFSANADRLLFVKDGYSNNSFGLTNPDSYILTKYNLTNNHKLSCVRVQYNDDNTVVTDIFDNSTTYYFNSDSTCKYSVDSFRNYMTYTYNAKREVLNCGAMSYNSGNMLTNGDLTVTISDGQVDIEGFEWGGTALKIKNESIDNPFSQYGYSSVLEVETPEKTQSGEECRLSIFQTLERNISLNDSFEFSFLIKNNSIKNNANSKVEVFLVLIGEDDKNIAAKYVLDLTKSEYMSWQLSTLAIVAEQAYNKIQVLVDCRADVSFDIGAFRLTNFKKSVDFTYNGDGKVGTVSIADNVKVYSYDGFKLESTTDTDGNYVRNYYDDQNRLVKMVYPNGIVRTYQYNDKNNQVTCDTLTSYRYEMSTEKEFDTQGNFVKMEIDAGGFDTSYSYNKGKISQVKDPLGVTTNFEYYHNMDLKSLNVSNVTNGFGYEDGDMIFAETNDQPRYNLEYVDGNLQKAELLKNGEATTLCSYSYLTKNGVNTSLVTSKKYPNGEKYEFAYTNRGQTQRITYSDNNGTNKTVATFSYDSADGKLQESTDTADSRTTSYVYDMEGRVSQINSVGADNNQQYKYFYDAASNPLFNIKKYLSFENYSEILPLSRSTSISMEGLVHNYQNQEYFVAFFQGNFDLKNSDGTKSPTRSMSMELLSHYKALPCFRNTKNYSLCYSLNVASSSNYSQTAGFWFKFSNIPTSTVELLHLGNANQGLGLFYVNTTHKLQVKRGTTKLYESETKVVPQEWTFISLTQIKEGSLTQSYELCINGEIETFNSTTTTSTPTNIGIGGDLSKGSFIGDIAAVIVGDSSAINRDVLVEYYRYTKDLLVEVEEGSFSSLLNYYTFLDDCTIFPLHQNLKDIEQKLGPTNTIVQKPLDFDRDYIFNYNPYAHRYMYKCNGSPLEYTFSTKNIEATVAMCVVLDNISVKSDTKRYIMDLHSNGQSIGLYVNSDNRLVCTLDETVSLPTIEANKLHFISFSYRYVNKMLSFYVFLDNHGFGGHRDIAFGQSLTVSVGRALNGGVESALRGSVDMVQFRGTYSYTEDAYECLINQATLENVTHKFNEMGVLQEYNVSIGDKEVFKTEYTPQVKDGKLSGLIQAEKNKYFYNTYEYDRNSRIIKVNDKEYYKYNDFGYLIEDKDYKYTYDTHGNILTRYVKSGGKTLEYKYEDSRSADLLTSYNGIAVVYDEQNVGNLKSYGDIKYFYEGRRLTRYESPVYNETYKYNASGLRIQKKVHHNQLNVGWTTNYVYEGERLLYEETDGKITRFVYDENGQLYGFIDNSVRYFYLRDFQQRIVGIVNEEGKYIAGYSYDSYGKTEIVADREDPNYAEYYAIATANPFRYKGYYYDQEIEYYYCKSRYYNPEWGRWLTADDVNYLDSQDIGGLNLFAYCGNNPVMRLDSQGRDWSSFWNTLKTRAEMEWNKFVNSFMNLGNNLMNTVEAVIDSFVFDAGVGVGYGVEVEAGPVTISAVSRTDVFSIKGDQESANHPFGMRQVAELGIGFGEASISYVFRDHYESYDGQVVENSQEFGAFFGIGVGVYLGIGANISIGFNLTQLLEQLDIIWGY